MHDISYCCETGESVGGDSWRENKEVWATLWGSSRPKQGPASPATVMVMMIKTKQTDLSQPKQCSSSFLPPFCSLAGILILLSPIFQVEADDSDSSWKMGESKRSRKASPPLGPTMSETLETKQTDLSQPKQCSSSLLPFAHWLQFSEVRIYPCGWIGMMYMLRIYFIFTQ